MPKRLPILFCGSRKWTNRNLIIKEIEKIPPDIFYIIHGGAPGADSIAGDVAHEFGLDVEVFSADWAKYGRRAGPIRNIEMLDQNPIEVIAFGGGKGTSHTVKEAIKRGILVKEISDVT